MEFWLSFNNGKEKLQLPVPPPSFEIKRGKQVEVVTLQNIGEVAMLGKGKLATVTISSFFPAQAYPFVQYRRFPKPYNCVKLIEKWQSQNKPIRLIITDTPINIAATIQNFEYGERDGTGDVYYTLELLEYRFLSVKPIKTSSSGGNKKNSNTKNNRPSHRTPPRTYVVKAGDTLIELAIRFYGDSSKWRLIAQKNGIKDPRKLPVGKKLVI